VIANARMYSVSPEATDVWRELLLAICAQAGLPAEYIEHAPPAPLEDLWRRTDSGATFMCGLPFSRAQPQPLLVAAPVPAPPEFGDQAQYCSDLVVRADSPFRSVADTFGGRLALTVPGSQSGCVAALTYFMGVDRARPLFAEIIAPTITPLGALCAVVDGRADVAPLDSYAFRLLQRYRPDLTVRVRRIGQTVPTPIPPLVASPGVLDRDRLRILQSAFLEAHRNASITPLMDELLLRRFALPSVASYEALRLGFEAATRYWAVEALAAVTHPDFAF
jgi:ABC-type phosphate/phosphonate transport system substrate-binding protein